MMTTNHPITPSPELVRQWLQLAPGTPQDFCNAREVWLINHAYAAGSDQELDACCEWLDDYLLAPKSGQLRAARRPKPLSLKEQALRDLDALAKDLERNGMGFGTAMIRRALEQLND